MKCKRACYTHYRHWHPTSAAEKRELSSSKIHRQYKHVAERAATKSSRLGPLGCPLGLHVHLPLTPPSLRPHLSSFLQGAALLQAAHAVQVCG